MTTHAFYIGQTLTWRSQRSTCLTCQVLVLIESTLLHCNVRWHWKTTIGKAADRYQLIKTTTEENIVNGPILVFNKYLFLAPVPDKPINLSSD